MHNRFFCTGVKLCYCVWDYRSILDIYIGQRYKNIPDLGLKQEPLRRFL